MHSAQVNGTRNITMSRRRWGIAWLLSFGVLVNYFDRVNLSVSQDALRAAFGISPVLFGYLSSAYSWTYAACQLPSGLLLRSEEHTSELQSQSNLVCRLLLEKKNNTISHSVFKLFTMRSDSTF